MIPVARQLTAMGQNVIIASGEQHLALLRSELPELTFVSFTGFRPSYSRFLPQYISLFLKIPLLLFHIIREHYLLKGLVRKYSIDIVISDNRFGLWNKKVTSVYVTHMPRIPFPRLFRFMEIAGILLHRIIIRKYNYCLIPDLPGELNLSGRLSHDLRLPGNVRYAGILSRFSDEEVKQNTSAGSFIHNTIILSGPEPQRDILKQKLVSLLIDKLPVTVILEGKPGSGNEVVRRNNIILHPHPDAKEMIDILTGSDCIITRSGYTTIMELVSLRCSALLIPTPGQTEQEYLAEYLSEKGWFSKLSQKDLKEGVTLTPDNAIWSDEIVSQSKVLLSNVLEEILDSNT